MPSVKCTYYYIVREFNCRGFFKKFLFCFIVMRNILLLFIFFLGEYLTKRMRIVPLNFNGKRKIKKKNEDLIARRFVYTTILYANDRRRHVYI